MRLPALLVWLLAAGALSGVMGGASAAQAARHATAAPHKTKAKPALRQPTAHRKGAQIGRKPGRHPRTAAAASKAHSGPHRGAHRSGGKKELHAERYVPAVRSGLPNVQAQGALVLDENGHELYARNPDHERPIASISKLAATLAVMDRGLELEGLSTITKVDIDAARGGARSRLLEGMTLSNRDLLHAALMGSDNRAIPALGRAVKLSPTQLAGAMTAMAKDLGLKKTRFRDPTGLSMENVSTPRETIALLQAVMRHPVLGPITHRVQYDAHPIGRPPITYINTYRPAARNNVQVLGGKTGYNDDARYCLVLAAKIDGRTCFMSFLANEGKLTRFGDVARVADWVVSRRPKAQTTVAVDSLPGSAAALPGHPPAAGTRVAVPAAVPAAAPTEVPSGPPSPAARATRFAPSGTFTPVAPPTVEWGPTPSSTPVTLSPVPPVVGPVTPPISVKTTATAVAR